MRALIKLVFVLVLVTRVGVAETLDPAKADALFREGRALMKKKEFEPACQRFAESQRFDPAAGTLVNLSECMEKRGRLADALRALREALSLLKAGDDRIPKVKEQIASLGERVPRLVLKMAPDAPKGTKVIVDGVEHDAESLGGSVEVNPGEHVVEFVVPGKAQERRGVRVKEGEGRELVIGEREKKGEKPPAQAAPPYRTFGYVLGGVGLIALALGTSSYLDYRDRESEREGICPTEQNCSKAEIARDAQLESDADAAGRLAAIELGTGVLALGTGVFLLMYTPSGRDAQAALRVAPVVGRAGFGAAVGGTW